MEHRTKGRKLGRTSSHKKALMSNLSVSLIMNDRIKTTLAKAKELRLYVEPLVTKAKKANASTVAEKSVHLRRVAKQFLKDDSAVKKLFDELGPRFADRPGGYTRVLKTGHRPGDGADTAIIEFVGFEVKEKETVEDDKTTKKKGKKTDVEASETPKKKTAKKKKDDVEETKSEEKKPKKKASKKKEE